MSSGPLWLALIASSVNDRHAVLLGVFICHVFVVCVMSQDTFAASNACKAGGALAILRHGLIH